MDNQQRVDRVLSYIDKDNNQAIKHRTHMNTQYHCKCTTKVGEKEYKNPCSNRYKRYWCDEFSEYMTPILVNLDLFMENNPDILTHPFEKNCLRSVISPQHGNCHKENKYKDYEHPFSCWETPYVYGFPSWPDDHRDVFALENKVKGPRILMSHEYTINDDKEFSEDKRWGKIGEITTIKTPWGEVCYMPVKMGFSWYYPDNCRLFIVAAPENINKVNLDYAL